MRSGTSVATCLTCLVLVFLIVGVAGSSLAQQGQQGQQGQRGQQGQQGAGRQGAAVPARAGRPPLFLREEWKQTPAGGEHAVTPDAIANPNLELKLYGSTSKDVQLTGSAQDENNPIHVWTGLCTTPCAVALRDKNSYADLTGLARMRWVTKMSGFHQVHPIVKLQNGTWLVGDHADGSVADWHVNEFSISEVRWLKLDIDRVVTTGNFVEKPDLSKVDEIGFVDLIPGSGHGAGGWADVAAIEVFGGSSKRP
jgi:hypothetical protein